MAAALQQPIDSQPEKVNEAQAEPCLKTVEADWQQQLSQLGQQSIEPGDRLHWMLLMREKFFADEPINPDNDTMLDLMIELAERLCDWPMVIQLRECLDNRIGFSDQAVQNTIKLASAYHQLGLLVEAADCIRSGLLVHYQQAELAQYYWQLQQTLNNAPFAPQDLQAGPLILTSLSDYHLSAFCWAYADPKISQLCNLPEFENDDHWLNWLANDQAQKHKYLFAVNHREWGFIGAVSLEVFDGIGFFYYWLGVDFQGHGFGPQAVDLLLNLAANCLGLHCCYAKVYDHNTPSQTAMEKLGFKRLPFAVEAPYDNEFLYYLGPDKPEQTLFAELDWLFAAQQSDTQLVGALASRMGCLSV
ncbi:MAG: GNAT family N-acetyltransferase [Psychrosphaera sp.]|nr:GNAT family N-acetyltransferase [Psychrosphaera sp.]